MVLTGSPAPDLEAPELKLLRLPETEKTATPLPSAFAGGPGGPSMGKSLLPGALAPMSKGAQSHTVRSGDTVWAIAAQHDTTVAKIISANDLGSNALIRVGQVLTIPGKASSTAASSPTTKSTVAKTHTVKAGQSLSGIAQTYGVTTAQIATANNISNINLIRAGQVLTIPGRGTSTTSTSSSTAKTTTTAPSSTVAKTHTVTAGQSLSGIAQTYGVTTAQIATANNISNINLIRAGQVLTIPGKGTSTTSTTQSTSRPSTPAAATGHVVKAGDTVWAIAQTYGSTTSAILAANGLSSDAMIRVGQKLSIPAPGTTPSTPTAAAPEANACKTLVPATFLHYTYSSAVVSAANENKCTLDGMSVPGRDTIQQMVRDTAVSMGLNPALAQAIAFQESSFDHRSVSPANAVGTMQVIPSSGQWAGQLLGRQINLLEPSDNIAAGVAILLSLQRTFPDNLDYAIGSYYQGAGSVAQYGLASDTRNYVNSVKAHMARFQ